MAAPNTTIDKARAIHAALVEAGYAGEKIKRPDFESAVAVHVQVTEQPLRRLVEAGRLLGLWALVNGGPRRGSIRVLLPQSAEGVAQPGVPLEA